MSRLQGVPNATPGPGSLILPTQICEARVSVGQTFILNFPGVSPKLTVWLREQELPVPQSWLLLPATCSQLSFSSTFRFRDGTGLRNQTHLDSNSPSGLGLSAWILSPLEHGLPTSIHLKVCGQRSS